MDNTTIVKTGIVGFAIVAMCCFAPILIIGLGAVGPTADLGWLDYVFVPALAVLLGLTAWVIGRRQKAVCCASETTQKSEES